MKAIGLLFIASLCAGCSAIPVGKSTLLGQLVDTKNKVVYSDAASFHRTQSSPGWIVSESEKKVRLLLANGKMVFMDKALVIKTTPVIMKPSGQPFEAQAEPHTSNPNENHWVTIEESSRLSLLDSSTPLYWESPRYFINQSRHASTEKGGPYYTWPQLYVSANSDKANNKVWASINKINLAPLEKNTMDFSGIVIEPFLPLLNTTLQKNSTAKALNVITTPHKEILLNKRDLTPVMALILPEEENIDINHLLLYIDSENNYLLTIDWKNKPLQLIAYAHKESQVDTPLLDDYKISDVDQDGKNDLQLNILLSWSHGITAQLLTINANGQVSEAL